MLAQEVPMMTSPAPSATSRALRTANDWWCIRGFILGTYPITPVEFIWKNRGWGGWRFHQERPIRVRRLREVIRIWEADGRIVGAAHPEGHGNVWGKTWQTAGSYVAVDGRGRDRPATATPTRANTAPMMIGMVSTSPSRTTPATTPTTGAR